MVPIHGYTVDILSNMTDTLAVNIATNMVASLKITHSVGLSFSKNILSKVFSDSKK